MADDQTVSREMIVPAAPAEIFELLRTPAQHATIDGSGTIVDARTDDATRLEAGSKFKMGMKSGLSYRITNHVVEYEQDRLIAWRHFGRHRWRYELEPVEGGTLVRETFDYSRVPIKKLYEVGQLKEKTAESIEKTLERLRDHFAEHRSGGSAG